MFIFCARGLYYCCIHEQKESSESIYNLFRDRQCIDNIYTQVAIHRFPIGSLAVSQCPSSSPQCPVSAVALEC